MGGLIRSSLEVLSPKIYHRTTMKAVFALLLVCLIQISFAEEQESIDSEGNLLLQREARDAGKRTGCEKGKKGRGCRRRLRKQSRKRKSSRKQSNRRKGRKGQPPQKKETRKRREETRERKKEKTKEKERPKEKEKPNGVKWCQIFVRKARWKAGHVLHRHGCQDEEVQQGP